MTPPDAPATVDWEEARSVHARLSAAAERFVDLARRQPELRRRVSYEILDAENPFPGFELQPWPALVDADRLDRMADSSRALARLVSQVPSRLLGRDPRRLAEFYGIDLSRASLACEVLSDAEYVEAMIGRGDFILGPAGFRCIEYNMSSRLGGWHVGLWRDLYRKVPVLDRFFADEKIGFRVTSAAASLFSHLLSRFRARHGDEGDEFNVGFAVTEASIDRGIWGSYVDRELQEVLARHAPGMSGTVGVGGYEELTFDGTGLYHEGRRLHAIVDQVGTPSREAFFCWMGGGVELYNAVLDEVLGDKRNLAALSEAEALGRLGDEDGRIVREHLPWTRQVAATETLFDGRTVFLPNLIRSAREDLVLKPAKDWGGKGVFLGSGTPQDEWDQRLDHALGSGDWVVQERVPSDPFLFQAGDDGCAPHDVVWGLYTWGVSGFSGGFLRMLPRAVEGIVNVSQGAVTGLIYEVDGERSGGV